MSNDLRISALTYKKKLLYLAISSIVVCITILSFYRKTPFIFYTNDDYYLKMIVAGEMTGTPCSRMLHIGFLPGLLLSTLYSFFPLMPWYGLFLCSSIGLIMVIVLYKLLLCEKTMISKAITIPIFYILSYGFLFLHFAEIQYTTVTGIVGAGAVFILVLSHPTVNTKQTLQNYFLFFLLSAYSYSIRSKAFLMLCPFILIFLIVQYFSTKSETLEQKHVRQNILIVAITFFAVLALVEIINIFAYSSNHWREFKYYNKVREYLYDYTGFPEYENHSAQYKNMEITSTSYEAAHHHYCVLLDPAINGQNINQLVNIAKEDQKLSIFDLPDKVKEMTIFFIDRHLSYTDRPLNLLVYSCYILFFISALIAGKKKAIIDIFFTGLGRMVIWIYLVYHGRLPARVSQAVYIAELLILIAIAIKYELWKKKELLPSKLPALFWSLCLCCFLFLAYRFGIPKAEASAWEASSRLQFSQSFVDMETYFAKHPDNVYYLDMNSFGSFTADCLQNGDNTYDNYFFMGSWIPHSPWYEAKFEKAGIKETDAAAALFENPNVYAVFMKTEGTGYEYLSDFYAENYPGVTIEVVEEITVSNDITFQIVKGKRS